MRNIKWLMFDCMETLIDMTELPTVKEYALWSYRESGVEHYWNGFEEFLRDFRFSREMLKETPPKLKEYEIKERYKLFIRMKLEHLNEKRISRIADTLIDNYWKTYKSKCFVSREVKDVLSRLAKKFRLGVVSNFIVRGGVEELLAENGISEYFDFVVTSVNEGWRKPHPKIYYSALEKAGVNAQEVIFIGDDYENDFKVPGEIGFTSILYDREKKNTGIEPRFDNFLRLEEVINRVINSEIRLLK